MKRKASPFLGQSTYAQVSIMILEANNWPMPYSSWLSPTINLLVSHD